MYRPTETIPFPRAIDNTMRSAFRKCPTAFALGYCQSLASPEPSVHLHAGAAYAKGLEVARKSSYTEGRPFEESILEGILALFSSYGEFDAGDSAKTAIAMAGALLAYCFQYPFEDDFVKPIQISPSRSGIEFSFALPLPLNHPVTGDPIMFAGRSDMICAYKETGDIMIEDDKTASQLGSSWSRQWDMDSQMAGYIYAAHQFGIPVIGGIFRGVSILKNGYGHAQVIQTRHEWELARWYEEFLNDVYAMLKAWESGVFSQTLDKAACAAYSGCSFKPVCSSRFPDGVIQTNYVQRLWDPLAAGH